MIAYITANGGVAEEYSLKNVTARPKWNDVKEYLKGNISFGELKRRMGC